MEITEIINYLSANSEQIIVCGSLLLTLLIGLKIAFRKPKVKQATSTDSITQRIRDSRRLGVICFPEKIEAKPKIITDKQEYENAITDYAFDNIKAEMIKCGFHEYYFNGTRKKQVKQIFKFTDAEYEQLKSHISDFESKYRYEKAICKRCGSKLAKNGFCSDDYCRNGFIKPETEVIEKSIKSQIQEAIARGENEVYITIPAESCSERQQMIDEGNWEISEPEEKLKDESEDTKIIDKISKELGGLLYRSPEIGPGECLFVNSLSPGIFSSHCSDAENEEHK